MMRPATQPRFSAWQLVHNGGQIDAATFLDALADPSVALAGDVRSQLLVRDGLRAIGRLWLPSRLARRIDQYPTADRLRLLQDALPGERGFWMLGERIVDSLDPKMALDMLRELGTRVARPATITIGGSIALILERILVRQTDDVDVVDELPEAVRTEYALLDELTSRYKLKIAHFQSHYLPDGWRSRTHSLGRFGKIDVHVVDAVDVLTGKLFSRRTKDLDDLREALPRINMEDFRRRIQNSTTGYRNDPHSLPNGVRNWYILTGESDLPPLESN